MFSYRLLTACVFLLACTPLASCLSQENTDVLRRFQFMSAELERSDWIHWGHRSAVFSNWTTHSNRLIPVYSFGLSLNSIQGERSCYRDPEALKSIYGQLPKSTLNPNAEYFDQTQIYQLQKDAWESGKKNIILMVFDGMDWNTTRAASIYKNKKVLYSKGRGSGLAFLDYQLGNPDFGYCVTSPHDAATEHDVDAQLVTHKVDDLGGGYAWEYGGSTPWDTPRDPIYLQGQRKSIPHPYTDSASSAVSLNAGKKTYNGSINFSPDGEQLVTLAHQMQRKGFSIGVVTSVPICHATPACVYSHNVTRDDYQDISRDLLGLPSIAHRCDPLPGVDVLIGCGWGELKDDDRTSQGINYVPGNRYISDSDIRRVDQANGGKYIVAQRSPGISGRKVLEESVDRALASHKRLFGFFGATRGHLPFQTADGNFNPTLGESKVDVYKPEDIFENPSLADMTCSALRVLERSQKGFFLMVECGDVDWANHNNNIDDAIGAVFSGEAAFDSITDWVEKNSNWDETCLIVTADHGHMMVLEDPTVLMGQRTPTGSEEFIKQLEDKRVLESEKRRIKDEGSDRSRMKRH